MNKTIGILAHVDAGKTTFSEQLLYYTNSIKQRGRVDHRNAFLDSHQIERERGITVFADQGTFNYGNSTYYLIDTPGHTDFSPEMERAIQAMDYAVVLLSAVEGIEGQTEMVWELLRKHKIPCFFFINKIDRIGADVEQVVHSIRRTFTRELININDASHLTQDGQMGEELIEWLAERDEALFTHFMDEGYDVGLWLDRMRDMVGRCEIFPYAYGSALHGEGIEEFLQKIELLTVTYYSMEGPFAGRVYRIRHDAQGTRLTFIKALSGTLKVRDMLEYGGTNGADERDGRNRRSRSDIDEFSDGSGSEAGDNTQHILMPEKVTQIRRYNGNEYKVVEQVQAGELFAVTGLTAAAIGDGVGALRDKARYDLVATLKSKVMFAPSIHVKEVLRCFRMLGAEDPSLNVTWDERLQELHIHVMGPVQLEVLQQVVLERFGLRVTFGRPEILYKETIATEVTGCGHFEPLGHYAEVHLRLTPGKRNSGIVFHNACHVDELPANFQNLVRQHLFEREHRGLLTGSPLTDVEVTLLTGRAHNKHTTGGDFREATFRALRQGLEKADNVLLEPYYNFKIKVEHDQIGRVISDVIQASGSYDVPVTEGDKVFVTGRVPVSTFMDYASQLAAYTQGKGMISLSFAGYDRCHNEQEIIERMGYNKDADPEYTSSSIFCAKGQGYTVDWQEAEAKMHARP